MNVAADMAVWCHVRVATAGVLWVLLAAFTYVTLVPSEMWCGTCLSLHAR